MGRRPRRLAEAPDLKVLPANRQDPRLILGKKHQKRLQILLASIRIDDPHKRGSRVSIARHPFKNSRMQTRIRIYRHRSSNPQQTIGPQQCCPLLHRQMDHRLMRHLGIHKKRSKLIRSQPGRLSRSSPERRNDPVSWRESGNPPLRDLSPYRRSAQFVFATDESKHIEEWRRFA